MDGYNISLSPLPSTFRSFSVGSRGNGDMEVAGDAERNAEAQSRPRRRATKACQFCRRRKLKCDNDRPRCANCKNYEKECIYVDLPKRLKPSSARIADLEKENQRLHAQLHVARSVHDSDNSPQDPSPTFASKDVQDTPFVDENVQTSSLTAGEVQSPSFTRSDVEHTISPPTVSVSRFTPLKSQSDDQTPSTGDGRSLAPPADQVGYYGRTSALFDDGGLNHDRRRSNSRNDAGRPSDRSQLILMGEAARQRQMETINYKAGRCDFDGVDSELAMHLLSLHWNRQHHSSLITYRPAFTRDMACEGPYFSKLLLNAIFFGASKFSTRPELRNNRKCAGHPYRQRVKELLGESLDRSRITTIQALLIMTSSLFALGDERSAAWLYAGIAFRMIIDLGLHIEDPISTSTSRLSEEDYEIRRRVFWGAFVVDKIQSLYQGRPMSLQEADIQVPMLIQDNFEELELWHPQAFPGTQNYSACPTYSVSTFTELCKLSVIMNDILNKVYAEKTTKLAPERLAKDLKTLYTDLERWEDALPHHLKFESIGVDGVVPPPHVLSLQAMHKVLIILLHRPFVSEGHLHTTSLSIPVNSFVICAVAATKIVQLLRIYDRTFSVQQAPYLMSYATYVSATIHVRIAAQRGPGSEAHTSLATCLAVFSKNEETNWAVRRARMVILKLMSRMNVIVSNPEEERSPEIDDSRRVHVSSTAVGLSERLGNNDVNPFQVPNSNSPGHYQQMAGDLDMDAIIQSFIHEQNSMYNMDTNLAYERHHHDHPAQHAAPVMGQPPLFMSYPATVSSTWTETNDLSNTSVEDMLFGFNGNALDNVW